jgi:hypothetical protein
LVLAVGEVLSRQPNKGLRILSRAAAYQILDTAVREVKADYDVDLGACADVVAEAALASSAAYGEQAESAWASFPDAMRALGLYRNRHRYQDILDYEDRHPGEQPDNACQDACTLEDMQKDMLDAQRFMKGVIAPDTEWAGTDMNSREFDKSLRLFQDRKQLPLGVSGAFDPGIKGQERILQKSRQKYNGNIRRVRDGARLALICDTPWGILKVLDFILENFPVIAIENRFATPTGLGWRDVTVLVLCGAQAGRSHVGEIQVQLRGFYLARLEEHKRYGKVRVALGDLRVDPNIHDAVLTRLIQVFASELKPTVNADQGRSAQVSESQWDADVDVESEPRGCQQESFQVNRVKLMM